MMFNAVRQEFVLSGHHTSRPETSLLSSCWRKKHPQPHRRLGLGLWRERERERKRGVSGCVYAGPRKTRASLFLFICVGWIMNFERPGRWAGGRVDRWMDFCVGGPMVGFNVVGYISCDGPGREKSWDHVVLMLLSFDEKNNSQGDFFSFFLSVTLSSPSLPSSPSP